MYQSITVQSLIRGTVVNCGCSERILPIFVTIYVGIIMTGNCLTPLFFGTYLLPVLFLCYNPDTQFQNHKLIIKMFCTKYREMYYNKPD